MGDQRYFRPTYTSLNKEERESLLISISSTNPDFVFIRFAIFSRFGQSTDTAVFGYKGTEFVFVPGDTVTLGWESFDPPLTKEELGLLQEDLYDETPEEFFKSSMSPVRTVTIRPMLVERRPKELGWILVPPDHPKIQELQSKSTMIIQSGDSVTYVGNMRIRLYQGEQLYELYSRMSYSDFLKETEFSGFRIPDEDEYEYLCGGGSRTLFRWGNMMKDELATRFRIPPEQQDIDVSDGNYLPGSNFFGVSINFDPYKQEVVDSAVIVKGGDGGCAICGGSSYLVGFMSFATYFRENQGMRYMFEQEITGDYTIARRIRRL